MQISFFEEFPTVENLNKLKLVRFPIKLYVAAHSYNEFLKLKKKIRDYKTGKIREIIYWAVFSKQEGYWISPFTKREALLRVFGELGRNDDSVMLDLELPTTKNLSLYVTQLFNFFRNKKLIRDFIGNYKGEIYTAEYFPTGWLKLKLMKFLGLHFEGVKVIKMLYHSMLKLGDRFFRMELRKGQELFGSNYLAGFGTIAKGIMGWEPILDPGQLEKDLQTAKEVGVKEIVIFRLGGLNKEYVQLLQKI